MGIRSAIGRAFGSFGGFVRRIADFGGHVVRKIGEYASPVGNIAGSIADVIGRPDIGTAIRVGADWVGNKFAPQAENILSKVGSAGSTMKGIGTLINR